MNEDNEATPAEKSEKEENVDNIAENPAESTTDENTNNDV